ncbi:hypothetical protein LX36DRAFT_665074 [Colletotrichum falcatum]|nr:hypothetical protein LX36DRAFT_665074 [Colletotrichum falcatum]
MESTWVTRRNLQLQTEDCWREHCLKPDGEMDRWPSDCDDGLEHRLWCLITVTGVDVSCGSVVVESVRDVLPLGAKYYGVLEHHTGGTVGEHSLLHCCIAILVGFSEPSDVGLVRQRVSRLVQSASVSAVCTAGAVAVDACPGHIVGGDPSFLSVVHWVLPRFQFVEMARSVAAASGNKRMVFGHDSVMSLLGDQFGSSIRASLCDLVCVEEIDEERRVTDQSEGGFVPSAWGVQAVSGGTIYVADTRVL